MFYSYEILNIRSGKMSLIWLAAHNKLKKSNTRQILDIAVDQMCRDIMKFLPSERESVSARQRPRSFSLYLSAMLMNGTVKVYKWQVNTLLITIKEAMVKSKLTTSDIDLPQISMLSKERTILQHIEDGSSVFFGATTFDFVMEDGSAAPLCTPRKITPSKKSKRRSREESETLRSLVDAPSQGPDLFSVNALLQEWDERAMFPHSTDPANITLIEDIPIPTAENLISKEIDDFGGILAIPEEFLRPIASAQPGEELTEQPSVQQTETAELVASTSTVIGQPQDDFVTPFVAPAVPEQPAVVKKKPRLEHDTIDTPIPPKQLEGPSPIHLEELDIRRSKTGVQQRRFRRRFIWADETTKLSKEEIKREAESYHLKQREQNTKADMIRVQFWKFMKSPHQMLGLPQRRPMAQELSSLILRHHVTHFAYEGARRRQLEFNSNLQLERDRDFTTPLSDASLQISNLESSKASSDRSIRNVTGNTIVTPAECPEKDQVNLYPIREEEIIEQPVREIPDTPYAIPPRSIQPAQLFRSYPPIPGGQEETVSSSSHEEPGTAADYLRKVKKRGAKDDSPDQGFQTVTIAAEVYEEPQTSLGHPLLEPSQGFALPSDPRLEESVIAPHQYPPHDESVILPNQHPPHEESVTVPHQPLGIIAPAHISPIRSRKPQVEETIPEWEGNLIADLHCMDKGQRSAFTDLLTPGATRRQVAVTFDHVLKLHKKRVLKLEQEEEYGPITIQKLI